MSAARPNVTEERRIALRGRARDWQRSGWIDSSIRERIDPPESDWKRSSLFSRVGLFVLTILAVAAFYGLMHMTLDGAEGWITAAAAVGLAEFLIRQKRFLHTGLEEALYLAGLFALIFGLPGPSRNEELLLFGIASLYAGWRLVTPLFGAAAAFFFSMYFIVELDLRERGGWLLLAISLVATLILRADIRRPWIDRALAILVVAGPLAAWYQFEFSPGHISTPNLGGICAAILFMIPFGLLARLHPPILGALLVAVPTGFELGRRLPFRMELKWIGAGLLLLVVTLLVERGLRGRGRGITSRRLGWEQLQDLAEVAAVPLVAPVASGEGRGEGGGEFGGGGATSDY